MGHESQEALRPLGPTIQVGGVASRCGALAVSHQLPLHAVRCPVLAIANIVTVPSTRAPELRAQRELRAHRAQRELRAQELELRFELSQVVGPAPAAAPAAAVEEARARGGTSKVDGPAVDLILFVFYQQRAPAPDNHTK